MASPSDITGLVRRWRADSITGLADNTGVQTWPAFATTGGGVALTQATTTARPAYRTNVLNGQPVVRFDGNSDFMAPASAITHAQPVTVSIVMKRNAVGAEQQIFDGGLQGLATAANQWSVWGGTAAFNGGTADTAWHVLDFTGTGGTTAIFENGTQVASGAGGTQGVTAFAIGRHSTAGRYLSGDIAEINIYSKVLSAAERATLHTYYAEQYGISSSDVQQNFTRTPADDSEATDSASASVGWLRDAGDTSGTTDQAATAYGWRRSPGDTAGTAEGTSQVRQVYRGPADSALLGDAVEVEFSRADISDFQFVISEGPKDLTRPWVPFGFGQTVVVESFTPGGTDSRNQDVLSPVADERWFGRDLRTPPTWEFALYTDIDYDPRFPTLAEQQAHEWAQVMESVWNAEAERNTPNAVVPLRYRRAGQTRRVYGRPGDFTPLYTYARTGRIDMVTNFRLAETVYYDDVEQVTTVRTVSSTITGTGFTFPITFPLTMGAQGDSPRIEQLTVRGARPTWVDVTFYGPSIDPWVDIGGTRWGLRGEVQAGAEKRVRMSGKPWQRGIQRADGAWLPGMLDPRARLSQLRFRPGQYPVRYGAYDPAGTSYATVGIRNAYGTM